MWPFKRKPPLLKNHWAKESTANTVERPSCTCLGSQWEEIEWTELSIHNEVQDETAAGWIRLLELIDQAANDGREEFSPLRQMDPEQWIEIVTLPRTIARLKAVKHFIFYGSALVRIPPEIGQMTNLEKFTPYTSYLLHWFPYEVRRCKKLRRSTVSTRALYGNFKMRPPFPKLPQHSELYRPDTCSICDGPFTDIPLQRWTSRRMGSDVVPLLVHACSDACIARIKDAPDGYVKRPHCGGLELVQPETQC
ncbi:leucine-rich repeat domain-containing protein [Rhodopirellula baltica]|uniref:leucine-rich repeat domain-containing protein n=1 Tax=Rhodopirellula baltica TaxID=265606 RepID=UPI001F411773|nr:leucine-rich repeat domain-containing protein [Rhodopirellula baltica]